MDKPCLWTRTKGPHGRRMEYLTLDLDTSGTRGVKKKSYAFSCGWFWIVVDLDNPAIPEPESYTCPLRRCYLTVDTKADMLFSLLGPSLVM